jgi:rhodanese-related sulfurtransferase
MDRPVALLLLALLAPFPAVAAAGPGALASVSPGPVDGATGQRLAEAGALVLDVRSPEEFAQGHVPGAKNIPHDQVARRAAELGPTSTPIVVYCRSGRRSAAAIETLKELGYERLWNAGGYAGWGKAP